MYDFDRIYDELMFVEGGYVNDPSDSGGETYKGISRKYHPYNPIWDIIDAHKNQWNFMPFLETSEELSKLVKEFYFNIYTKNNLDKLYCFSIKRKVFLAEINIGERKANRYLQISYNFYRKSNVLSTDGIIGPNTIKAINSLSTKPGTETQKERDLLNFFKGELYCNYKKIVTARPKDKKFFKGWVRRAFQ